MQRWIISEKEILLTERIRQLTERIVEEREIQDNYNLLYMQLEKELEEYRNIRGYARGPHITFG